jgi:hypothetical protein
MATLNGALNQTVIRDDRCELVHRQGERLYGTPRADNELVLEPHRA